MTISQKQRGKLAAYGIGMLYTLDAAGKQAHDAEKVIAHADLHAFEVLTWDDGRGANGVMFSSAADRSESRTQRIIDQVRNSTSQQQHEDALQAAYRYDATLYANLQSVYGLDWVPQVSDYRKGYNLAINGGNVNDCTSEEMVKGFQSAMRLVVCGNGQEAI